MYGKGKVGQSVMQLSQDLHLDMVLMDDADRNDAILHEAESIVVTPGLPAHHDIWTVYRDHIIGELDFVARYVQTIVPILRDIQWLGVTGTNGKSTVTSVLYQVLSQIVSDYTVYLGGNTDRPVTEIVRDIMHENHTTKRLVILEVSSFMLYNLENFHFSYGAFLNIARDHLDRHGSMEEYFASKEKILLHSDVGFVWVSLVNMYQKLQKYIVLDYMYPLEYTHFVGQHNSENLWSVYSIVQRVIADLWWDIQSIGFAIQQAQPLSHRLQLVANLQGIQVYDDSICTSTHALRAALESFSWPLVLIAGGYDKGDDYSILADILDYKVIGAVLMGQTGSVLQQYCKQSMLVDSLKDAMEAALSMAKRLGVQTILYSPGAASFDMFTNVYDRARQFTLALQHIQKLSN